MTGTPKQTRAEEKRRSAAVTSLGAAAATCEIYGRKHLSRMLNKLAEEIRDGLVDRVEVDW